jgi:TPR repeat protein
MKKGLGVEKNESMAVTYYLEASRKFGHFGATFELGTMYLLGCGVDRSPTEALRYLSSVASMGPWVGWVRRGLDAYLEGQHALSAMCYLHAANIGGEIHFLGCLFTILYPIVIIGCLL